MRLFLRLFGSCDDDFTHAEEARVHRQRTGTQQSYHNSQHDDLDSVQYTREAERTWRLKPRKSNAERIGCHQCTAFGCQEARE